jgi:hypothetical protein
MPAPLQSKINLLSTEMLSFGLDMNVAYQHCYNLAVQLNAEGNPNSSTQCYALANDIFYMYNHWYSGSGSIRSLLVWCLQYINDNAFNGGGGGVTMADMLAAMLAASFEELTAFMGITQAYKTAVWDAPFNEEYYAALARGFRQWGT